MGTLSTREWLGKNAPSSIPSLRPLFRFWNVGSLSALLHISLTGKFFAGGHLATTDGSNAIYKQLLLAAGGRDGSFWIFYETDDGPFQNGRIATSLVAPDSPIAGLIWQDVAGFSFPQFTSSCRLQSYADGNFTSFHINADSSGWTISSFPVPNMATGAEFTAITFTELGQYAYGVDSLGTVQEFSPGSPPTPLSGPGFAPPGAPVEVDSRVTGSSVGDPGDDPLDLFVVGNDGHLWVIESTQGLWQSPVRMPGDITLVPGSHIAAGCQVGIYHSGLGSGSLGYSQLDVFVVDASGTLQVWWESQGSSWSHGPMPNGSGFPPGAPIGIGYQAWDQPWQRVSIGNQLDVLIVDANGILKIFWVYQSGNWADGVMPGNLKFLPGSQIVTGLQGEDSDLLPHQLDVFIIDPNGQIRVYWESDDQNWATGLMPGS